MYASPEFLDGGFTAFKANVNKMILLKSYAVSDTYAAVNVTNNLAEIAVATGDFTLSGADGADRIMTSTAKNDVTVAASSGASPNLHIAFVDTVNSKIYWVTDEASDQVITAGNKVNFPALTCTNKQPTV